MSTVGAIETVAIDLPVRPDLIVHGARGKHDRSNFLLVRVITADGAIGYGEVSATPIWSGEDGTSAEHFIKTVLAPALIGRSLAPVGALDDLMDRVLNGNPFTKAGVSIALWDAYARTLNVPLAQALGGPYRTAAPIKLSLSGNGTDLDRTYETAYAAGFRSFKVKVGLGVEQDVLRMARARDIAGPATFLGVDANGGWSRREARQAIAQIAEYRPAFVEQPLQPADLDGMRELRDTGFPVVADESIFGMDDLVRVFRAGAADVASIYVGKAGGPGRAVALGQTAAAFGMETLIGSNGELGIGAAAQLHVACALPRLSEFPSDVIGAHYYAEDALAEPLPSDGVTARLPASPGLGVILRDDLIKQFR
jgi:L-alanine-DL-glutamate epimerase-like enolase superfamily enzyme